MANEPVTSSPVPAPSVASQSHIRTFAQDVARLSGKPVPKATVPSPVSDFIEPVPTPKTPPKPPQPTVVPAPLPKEPVAEPAEAFEPPPAQIIPKAPTTDESREAVLARLKARVTPPSEPVPEPPAFIVPKAPSTGESREDVLARLRAKAEASLSEAQVKLPQKETLPQKAPLQPAARTRITAPLTQIPGGPERIHTYKTDFAGHAHSNDASRISVLAAEADALPTDRVIFKEKKPFPLALVGGLVLILLGGGALYGAYYFIQNQVEPVFAPNVPSLIAPDERIEIVGADARTEFLNAIATPLAEGSVRVVYTSISTTSEDGSPVSIPQPGGTLIPALSLLMPEVLSRSIQEESTLGAVRKGGEQRAFFLLRVDSFERAFAGMLSWERLMLQDLAVFYPEYPQEVPVTASTTAPNNPTIALPLNSSFKDELVGNRDVRVLRDAQGKSVMLYGFPDKQTLLIVRDEGAYATLIERLAASRGN